MVWIFNGFLGGEKNSFAGIAGMCQDKTLVLHLNTYILSLEAIRNLK